MIFVRKKGIGKNDDRVFLLVWWVLISHQLQQTEDVVIAVMVKGEIIKLGFEISNNWTILGQT